ncbi:undecaprenyl-phosphate galactose phosphotransferase WbaP [uncultured Bilophila sp.]|uniref:undecaprenyl-phosphate galactose phosphotransferase WbaP n=1 Tax=uncultured Bilophila sp. TaxID=529385 RepID=UPI0025D8E10E|nr:undecaprenyl-phosphate galactose phosphotransferase WbaP [uncultured Bilophila sp.]
MPSLFASHSSPGKAAFTCTRRTMLLLAADCTALFGCMLLIGLLRVAAGGEISLSEHVPLSLFLLVAPMVNAFEGLYSEIPPALPEEMRMLGISTSLAYFSIAIFLFLGRGSLPSRTVYVWSWVFSLGLVPLIRCAVRARFSREPWWGVPTVLFGSGQLVPRVKAYLDRHLEAGLRPQARFVSAACAEWVKEGPSVAAETASSGLEKLYSRSDLETFVRLYPKTCAVVVMEKDAPSTCRQELSDLASLLFSTVIIVPEDLSEGEIPFWVRPLEIGEVLCLQVRQNLLDPRRLILKRGMDLLLSFVGGLLILPFFLIIGLAIKLETPGPVFFRQSRIGRDGQTIRILKFRTMVRNAEEVLEKYLAANPGLRKEWEEDQKLRHDPRITRIGTLLRRTSLDELPQLWNVLIGQMSLVGPRPIVEDEIIRYGSAFNAYKRVRPGMTGLWQVSGRNDLSYKQRVHLDRFYISNWSTWLDLLILARTLPVVLGRKGAY